MLITLSLAASSMAADTPAPPEPNAQALKVMTFNIRYATSKDGEDAWDRRRDQVADLIRDQKPDVVGLQEALRPQLDDLQKALPEYEEFGVGRSDGKAEGEYSALLYRRGRFEREDGGTFWFSDTPEVPGSKHWGNRSIRICTWMRLKEKSSGRAFYIYNLHIDHESQPSREKSVQLLLKRIRERKHPDPVIVTGDFNAAEDNPAVRAMLESSSPKLADTFRVEHPKETNVGTYHGFSGKPGTGKIDYVFASEAFGVRDAEILRSHRNGRYPSDHFPVTAVLEWKDRAKE